MKIYISGRITGTDDFKPRFNLAAIEILRKGHEAINPVGLQKILAPETTSWAQYMAAALGLLYASDAVLLLPDWENSKGAQKERAAARRLGMRIFYDPKEIPNAIPTEIRISGDRIETDMEAEP